ncbi:TIR domain-containing protein [Bradyrhizobium guangxiense]
MNDEVNQFLNSVSDAASLKYSDLVDLFVYYLTVKRNAPAATVTQVGECFRACDLALPSRLAPYLSDGLKSNPPKFVKANGGYKLQRSYREIVAKRHSLDLTDLSAKLGASSDVSTKEENSTLSSRAAVADSRSKSIFVVHGHNEAMKQTVARYVEGLGLLPIILHEQVNQGDTIIEKFERNAAQAGFAVVLMSADDEGAPMNRPELRRPRARQNVVAELGYFTGLLGRSKVCVLVSDDLEIPSDYLGVVYTKFDALGAWKMDLAKELATAGYIINPAALLR